MDIVWAIGAGGALYFLAAFIISGVAGRP